MSGQVLLKCRGRDLLQIEARINVAENPLIRLHNFFQIGFDEPIERVDMLFHKSFDLKKCWY
jgi:hypothetical protein